MQMFDEMKELSETPSHWIMPLNLFVALVSNRFPQLEQSATMGIPAPIEVMRVPLAGTSRQCVVTSGQKH